MKNPAAGGVFRSSHLRNPEGWTTTASIRNLQDLQAAIRAIEAGLVCLPDPRDGAFIFRRRLKVSQIAWLAESGAIALPPDIAAMLAAGIEDGISAREPRPPLFDYRDEAKTWVAFASLAERKFYMQAIWDSISNADRGAFLRRVAR